MQRSNLETVRELHAKLHEEGIEAAFEGIIARICDPQIAWYTPGEWPERSVYRGIDGLRELYAAWSEHLEACRWEVVHLRQLDDGRILALQYVRARIKGTRVPVSTPLATLSTLREGRIVENHAYYDWDEALKVADVPPDEVQGLQ